MERQNDSLQGEVARDEEREKSRRNGECVMVMERYDIIIFTLKPCRLWRDKITLYRVKG